MNFELLLVIICATGIPINITIIMAMKLVVSDKNNADVTTGLEIAFITLFLLKALNNKTIIGSNINPIYITNGTYLMLVMYVGLFLLISNHNPG
tara:strand:- start:10221 stop:10502 length:282 start_codon:yes stop_codon:yes gene_type:complete